MALPRDLVLVRHGESEGNVAAEYSKRGDNRYFTERFKSCHSSQWRLSGKGVLQAQTAGQWIDEHLGSRFDRCYTSEYIRAMETAAYLEIPNASWFADFFLRERDWGELDRRTWQERDELFQESMRSREIDSMYWSPPNGESMADLCIRLKWFLDTLHRECDGKRVIVVCHGEVMWGLRMLLERMPQQRFLELDRSKHPHDRIHNCQILHYTRCNPEVFQAQPGPYLGWMRSVCPWDERRSSNEWQRIVRPRYTNDTLLRHVMQVPRLINS